MSHFSIILSVVVASLLALFVWNAFSLKSLKKQSHLRDTQLNDAKYWELRYKYEFLIAIVGLITAVAGFLGYNSIQSIESAVRTDFNTKVDSVKKALHEAYAETDVKLLSTKKTLDQVNQNVIDYQHRLGGNQAVLLKLQRDQFGIRQTGDKSKGELVELSRQIDSINAKNKIKREFYLVTNVAISGKYDLDPATINFSELKTSAGDNLPKFAKPPIVIPALESKTIFRIDFTTKDKFGVTIQDIGESQDVTEKKVFYASFIIYPAD